MIGKNIRSNQGSVAGSMIMNLIVIGVIMLAVPFAVVSTERVQTLSEDESYFTPEKEEDFNHETGPRSNHSLSRYSYKNSTGTWHFNTNIGIYTTNQTGQDYHEVIFSRDKDDDCIDPIQEFDAYVIPVNATLSDAIEKDLKEFSFSAEFPRNTNLTIEIKVGGDSASYMLAEKDIEASTNMAEYSVEIDYSKILEADTDLSGRKEIYVVIASDDSTTYDQPAIQPADTLKFNIDLIHSTSRANRFFTTQIVSGILAIPVIIAGIFATPYFDFRDTFGGR